MFPSEAMGLVPVRPEQFKIKKKSKGWIGVDFDGTLVTYDHWRGADHVGEPIPKIINLVKNLLSAGNEVRIFTARVWHDGTEARMTEAKLAEETIVEWGLKIFGVRFTVTCVKDYNMVMLYDDRCRQVETNTGRLINP
jgi:hypothetical protein